MKHLTLQKTAVAFMIFAVCVVSGSFMAPESSNTSHSPAVETTGFLG